MSTIILGIESSCDDTSAAVLRDGVMLSNVIASQAVHEAFGGVVPELASRAHQQNIVPVVSEAIRRAGIKMEDLNAIAFTRGPGLMGSLLVGLSFAKGLASALNIPMIDVNHLQGHVMAHFSPNPTCRKKSPLSHSSVCLSVVETARSSRSTVTRIWKSSGKPSMTPLAKHLTNAPRSWA